MSGGAADAWVRMFVSFGKADLRGVGHDVDPVFGGSATGWEEAKQHCVVHGVKQSTYKLTEGWKRD